MGPQFEEKEISPPRSYRFGEFELDPVEESLTRDGNSLNINHRMFQVLLLLVERRGDIISKEEFFEMVWDGSYVEDNNLTVTIAAIRKTLGDDAKQVRFIENLPRRGYRFIAPVDRVFDDTAAERKAKRPLEAISGGAEEPREPKPTTFGPIRSFKFAIGILSVLLISTLAIATVGRKVFWPLNAPAADRIDSIAVLPFESQTAGAEYLADGLTDNIINDLSRRSGLRIIDRNSVFKYRGSVSDPVTAGRELNVRSIVTGQIEQSGDVLIITAEIFDLAKNSRVWRQQFRRKSTDLFATQLEIAQTIAQVVHSEPTDQEKRHLSRRQTEDSIAYDLYLRGRYYWNKRTNADYQKAAGLFREAIDRDPTFAKAYIGLADAYTLGGYPEPGLSPEEKNSIIRATIQKALEIDDSLGEAYRSLAVNECFFDWDLAAAESDYRRALELNPNDATAHHWYAEFLSMRGRFDESKLEYDRALSLDPLSLPIRTDRALGYFYARDYDTAIELLNKIIESNPDYERAYESLAFVYREKGMYGVSVDLMEKQSALQLQRGERSARLNDQHMLYLTNLRNGAKTAGSVGFWNAELKYGDPTPINKVIACSKLGNSDQAFKYLEMAIEARSSGMVWLKELPELDGIRSDPRYTDILRRVGFAGDH